MVLPTIQYLAICTLLKRLRRARPRGLDRPHADSCKLPRDRGEIVSDRYEFGSFGRFTEIPVADMPEDMKQAYQHTLHCGG
jgi:hypothetical protein